MENVVRNIDYVSEGSITFFTKTRYFVTLRRAKYNNNAIFAGVIDIYDPHFFIYGPPVSFMPEA